MKSLYTRKGMRNILFLGLSKFQALTSVVFKVGNKIMSKTPAVKRKIIILMLYVVELLCSSLGNTVLSH